MKKKKFLGISDALKKAEDAHNDPLHDRQVWSAWGTASAEKSYTFNGSSPPTIGEVPTSRDVCAYVLQLLENLTDKND